MKNKINKHLLKTVVLTAGLFLAASFALSAQGLYSRKTEAKPVATDDRAGIYNAGASLSDDSGILRAGGDEGGGNSNKVTDETVPVGEGLYLLFAGSLLYLLLAGKRQFRAGKVFPQGI